MCRVLAVARSGYYAWCRRPPSARARATFPLVAQIRAVHAASHGTYGSPRIHAELRAAGQRVGRHRVARLMRAAQVVGRPRRRRPRVSPWGTRSSAANRLARQFAVARWQPDQVWVADLTYVPTREGALGLNVVLDLASRRVVGWAMGSAPDSALPSPRCEWRWPSGARLRAGSITRIRAVSLRRPPIRGFCSGPARW